MKATFKNIGPIKDAELELGDLTIIAGQNNTGKTYLVYTLYGFLDFCKNGFPLYDIIDFPEWFEEKIEEVTRQIEETGTARIELEEYEKIRNELINRAYQFFSQEIIHQVFSSPRSEFEGAHFQLDWGKDHQTTSDAIKFPSKDKATMKSFFQDDRNLIFEADGLESMPSSVIESGVCRLLARTALNIGLNLHILSAERFGISLFYKELDFTKNRLVEELQKLSDDRHSDPFIFIEKQSARYAQPIKDNIDFTRDLSNIQRQKSELIDDTVVPIRYMMDGYYKMIKDEIRFISRKRKDKFNIPLHLASSSARGLSDLYFYLKHKAAPNQLLIIDEPESHLSPTNQILMARLLVFCVNAGIKVLITTYSDYIIKEINNLIMLHGDFDRKKEFLVKHKREYTEIDHLDPKSVRAYLCEKGGLRQCTIDKQGIDGMTVFDNAIDGINQISAELTYMKRDDSKDD